MSNTGRFKLEKNEHFVEHLIALGIPYERARIVDSMRPNLELTIDGDRLTIISFSGDYKQESNLIFDQEVDETVAAEMTIKSVAKRKGDNKIEIYSRGNNGEKGHRLFEFFGETMIMSLSNDLESIPVAKRYYRKI
ncbi:fatty acid-binding protein-like [Rhynchophorus ferrugineus]|uniref:Fatty acid-binding protein n=1 Tax=Rhynchophorus ferrugineus TaxID=354439 RepID=A0A834HN90_RHYFE|nr:hypothetical protein GWI33_000407 [Rhynchophorus ferrugineus]KAF7264274.1 hypothetical protein GWI33_000406 [Rhynchophorus ferrugineus]